ERLDLREGVGVLGDVDDVVGHAGLVQGALGRIALHAEGLGVHGDVHGKVPFSRRRADGARSVSRTGGSGWSEDRAVRYGPLHYVCIGGFRSGSRSPEGLDRCGYGITTPCGRCMERPRDVLSYISVFHSAVLTGCGLLWRDGDNHRIPRTKREEGSDERL